MEHPENLGLAQGQLPGTIWDFPRMISLRSSFNVQTGALFQCHFGAISKTPTRFVSNAVFRDTRFHIGLPSLNPGGVYLGPLPSTCGHNWHATKLIGKSGNGSWNTSVLSAYSSQLCRALAVNLLRAACSSRGKSRKRSPARRFASSVAGKPQHAALGKKQKLSEEVLAHSSPESSCGEVSVAGEETRKTGGTVDGGRTTF